MEGDFLQFQERLLQLRKANHFTQTQVAEKLGIKQTTYSAYERGINQADIAIVCALSELYAVSIDYLCGIDDNQLRTDNMRYSTFGERLVTARKAQRKTQTELANVIGVSQANYSAYERGRIQPGISTVSKLAGALNVSMDYLCGYEDNAPTAPTTTTATLLAKQVESLLRDLSPGELQEAVKAIETLTAIAKKKIPDTQKDRP